ncbi:Nucleolar protein 56, partial [Fragariocoptes setiger]
MDGQTHLHILLEHATGYSLFRVVEFEDIGAFQPQVTKATLNYSQFTSLVKLVAFTPFKNGQAMLENAQAIAEGAMSPDLELFLEENLPSKMKKRRKWLLGVSEPKIGAVITEKFQVQCSFSDIVPEIIRGIKYHYEKLISECVNEDILKSAESSLGRASSRSKVKFNVNRTDQMIIQSICLLDKLDKDINTFAMRLREWYSFHFPELFKIVNDNYKFARLAQIIADRNKVEDPDSLSDQIEAIVEDAEIKDAVIQALKTSMGMEISDVDMENVQTFTTRLISLIEYRNNLLDYLASRMHNVAPNLSSLIGELVGARLINRAGSLTNLAKYPASTIQILGAEKALFRALKSRGKTPKYGLIFQSSFIGRAAKKNRGRMSRLLANKCAIASRIDCLSDDPSNAYGLKLKEQVEERLKFLSG